MSHRRSRSPLWYGRNKQIRRDAAAERAAERAERSAAEQLALLVQRGHQHCDEAKRLADEVAA